MRDTIVWRAAEGGSWGWGINIGLALIVLVIWVMFKGASPRKGE